MSSQFPTSTINISRGKAVSNEKLTVGIDVASPNIAGLAQNFTDKRVAIGLKIECIICIILICNIVVRVI
jgi:hypothetical protein